MSRADLYRAALETLLPIQNEETYMKQKLAAATKAKENAEKKVEADFLDVIVSNRLEWSDMVTVKGAKCTFVASHIVDALMKIEKNTNAKIETELYLANCQINVVSGELEISCHTTGRVPSHACDLQIASEEWEITSCIFRAMDGTVLFECDYDDDADDLLPFGESPYMPDLGSYLAAPGEKKIESVGDWDSPQFKITRKSAGSFFMLCLPDDNDTEDDESDDDPPTKCQKI
jgi:hypothetical protein